MALKINIKELPPYAKAIFAVVPSILLIVLFIFLIYSPKKKEIDALTRSISKLDNEIATGEVKIRKLDQLKAENKLLKAKLAKLQEQLPQEQEVSPLLKQTSDLGIKSGLEILLWKPGTRKVGPNSLYYEIPVKVEVTTGYHNLGIFFSHISRLARIVNIKNMDLSSKKRSKHVGGLIRAKFTALTFAAIPPKERASLEEKGKKRKRRRRK
jgi:type IV pilus assembly protein PilO